MNRKLLPEGETKYKGGEKKKKKKQKRGIRLCPRGVVPRVAKNREADVKTCRNFPRSIFVACLNIPVGERAVPVVVTRVPRPRPPRSPSVHNTYIFSANDVFLLSLSPRTKRLGEGAFRPARTA